jgi:hypothetical protein
VRENSDKLGGGLSGAGNRVSVNGGLFCGDLTLCSNCLVEFLAFGYLHILILWFIIEDA